MTANNLYAMGNINKGILLLPLSLGNSKDFWGSPKAEIEIASSKISSIFALIQIIQQNSQNFDDSQREKISLPSVICVIWVTRWLERFRKQQ